MSWSKRAEKSSVKNSIIKLSKRAAEYDSGTTAHLLAMTVMRIVYDLIYVFALSDIYEFAGFYLNPTFFSWSISWVCFLGTIFILKSVDNGRSFNFFIDIWIMIFLIPAVTQYGFGGVSPKHMLLTAMTILIIMIIPKLLDYIPKFKPKFNINLRKPALVLMAVLSISIVSYTFVELIRQNEFQGLTALNFSKVYEVRSQLKMTGLLARSFSWTTKSIIPFLFCISLKERKWWLTVMTCAVQFLFYIYTGHKIVLFLLPIILIVYFARKLKSATFFACSVISAVFGILGISAGASGTLNSAFSLVVRRSVALPAMLNASYIDFADTYGFLYFGETSFGKIIGTSSPYPIDIPYVIGLNHLGSATGANTGIVGSAYMDLGVWGVVISAVTAGLVFGLLRLLLRRRLPEFFLPLSIIGVVGLLNSSFFTYFSSHGFFWVLIMSFIYSLMKNGGNEDIQRKTHRIKLEKPKKKHLICAGVFILAEVFALMVSLNFNLAYDGSSYLQAAANETDTAKQGDILSGYLSQREKFNLSVPVSDSVKEILALKKQSSVTESDFKNTIDSLDYTTAEFSQKCIYVKSMAKEFYATGGLYNEPDFKYCYLDLIDSTNLSAEESLLLLETLIFTDGMGTFSNRERINSEIALLAQNVNELSVAEKSLFSYLLSQAVSGDMVDSEKADEFKALAADIYNGCMGEMDREVGVPIWKTDGEIVGFSDMLKIHYGLLGFEKTQRGSSTDALWKSVADPNWKMGMDSTENQISGSLALYMYRQGMAYKETSWINSFTVDGSQREEIDEIDYFYGFELLEVLDSRSCQNLVEYYLSQRDENKADDEYIYLAYLANEIYFWE